MDMELIKPSIMSTFRAILYSSPHILMLFIDRHILLLTIATHTTALGSVPKEQKNRIGRNYTNRNYTAIDGRGQT